MRFLDELHARQFFIDKVSKQADKSGVSLSEAERYMLTRKGNENASAIDKRMRSQFYAQTTSAEFEQKVAGLLKKAYEGEVNADHGKKGIYRNAYKTLSQGDHYIQMMVEDSIGKKIKKVRIF